MRRARITYIDAYHHVMNRGVRGENIFPDDVTKGHFLEILKGKSKKLRIRLLTYCIMDNHFHLVLQNTSGRLSDFMRELDGQYGMYYRYKKSGKGYVFQNRYKSTLIQEGRYLNMAIIYVLLNPVRAEKVMNPYKYRWSSINEYFSRKESDIVDNKFIDGIFGNEETLRKLLKDWADKGVNITKTRVGDILGEKSFIKDAVERFDRREHNGVSMRERKDDYIFEPVEKLIKEFEKEHGIKIDKININSIEGKLLRGELIVLLKDFAGLKYTDIIKYTPFQSLKYSSLGQIYKRTKERLLKRKELQRT